MWLDSFWRYDELPKEDELKDKQLSESSEQLWNPEVVLQWFKQLEDAYKNYDFESDDEWESTTSISWEISHTRKYGNIKIEYIPFTIGKGNRNDHSFIFFHAINDGEWSPWIWFINWNVDFSISRVTKDRKIEHRSEISNMNGELIFDDEAIPAIVDFRDTVIAALTLTQKPEFKPYIRSTWLIDEDVKRETPRRATWLVDEEVRREKPIRPTWLIDEEVMEENYNPHEQWIRMLYENKIFQWEKVEFSTANFTVEYDPNPSWLWIQVKDVNSGETICFMDKDWDAVTLYWEIPVWEFLKMINEINNFSN